MANDVSFAVPLIRQFSKQIAGHAVEKGSSKPGMMKHADGSLLKPILPPPRGPRELNFYIEASKDDNQNDAILASLRPLLPEFRGVFVVENENKEYLKLEDLTENFNHPCILDIKMGARTYDPEASEQKKRREQRKYRHTKAFGFCIPGMRVFHLPTQKYICKGKEYGKNLNEETVKDAFRLYLNGEAGMNPSIIKSFLIRLKNIQHWFSVQTKYSFYASSLLLIYEADSVLESNQNAATLEDQGSPRVTSRGEPAESPRVVSQVDASNASSKLEPTLDFNDGPLSTPPSYLQLTDVRMIDFAHVFDSSGKDENYLHGLDWVIRILQELLNEEK